MWPHPTFEFISRWEEDLALSYQQFQEAGVTVTEIDEGAL
jgi:hypothetical protein